MEATDGVDTHISERGFLKRPYYSWLHVIEVKITDGPLVS